MRFEFLELSGFRGFPQRRRIDLSADAIVIIGANGNGKTSLFDGLLWGLCGRIPRLSSNDNELVSRFSEEGQARVELGLHDPMTGERVAITRSFDGTEGRLTLATSDATLHGPTAEGKLLDLIWPDASQASKPRDALASVFTRSLYLQQDMVRQFVEADSDTDRFAAVSELVGAGRIGELQASLERSKKAWTTATNQRRGELHAEQSRLAALESRLAELESTIGREAPPMAGDTWSEWWEALEAAGITTPRVEAASTEAPAALERAMKELEGLRRTAERRQRALAGLSAEQKEFSSKVLSEVEPVRLRLGGVRKERDDLKIAIAKEQERLAEIRRLQAALAEKTAQLQALADIALRNLGDRCPVCDQTYDQHATKERLEHLKSGAVGLPAAPAGSERLTELLSALAEKESQYAATEGELRTAEAEGAVRAAAQRSLEQRWKELGYDTPLDRAALSQAIGGTESFLNSLGELLRKGEAHALRLAQQSAGGAAAEMRGEVDTLRRACAGMEREVVGRDATGAEVQVVIEGLRLAASALVEDRLNSIAPLLQGIYTRMDPHPAFRLVRFLSRIVGGRGRLSTVVSDPIEKVQSESPATVLSSSQVNALAVSVFLAMSIGAPRPPLQVAILDDPLQSLDDINLLGLVDLLRQIKGRRQLMVSTHDARFGNLLGRKLRPTSGEGRTIIIELSNWSRTGPEVAVREVHSDPVPLRLCAT